MKKLLFIFVIMFSLTSCGRQIAVSGSSDIKPLEFIEATNYTNIPEKRKQQLEEYVAAMDSADLLSVIRLGQLADKRITIKVNKPELISLGEISFEIVLENVDKKSVVLPLKGMLNYYLAETNIRNACIVWGNMSINENSIILTTLNHIYKIDIDSMSIEQLQPEFLTDIAQRYYLMDTISCDAGYTVSYMDRTKQEFVIFDKDGKTVNRIDTDSVFAHYNPSSSNNMNITYGKDCMTTFYADPQQTVIGITSDDRAYEPDGEIYPPALKVFFDITTGQSEHYPISLVNYSDDNYHLAIFAPSNYNTHRVIRRENGKVTDYFTFETDELGKWSSHDGKLESMVTADCGFNVVSAYCPYSRQTVTVDFINNSVDISTDYDENWQYSVFDTYKDRYCLCEGARTGAGDVSHKDIVLKDTETGQMKYIDTIGGMYGGSESAGFFSNGDVYTIGLDEFKVFTTDMSQQDPVFEMSKNFPLGSELTGDIYFRHLLAARRDPDNHSWVVLYNEAPYEEDANDWYMPDDFGDNFYKSTYKIGILDPQGNLTKVYDTGEHVMTYSFRTVEMYMKPGNIIHFSVLIKGTPQLEAELDLNTGEYTCISGGYNEWAK